MLLKDFIEQLQGIYEEAHGTHHFNNEVEVNFFLDDPADLLDLDIELTPYAEKWHEGPVRPWIMLGCGCWVGAEVHLRIKRQEASAIGEKPEP